MRRLLVASSLTAMLVGGAYAQETPIRVSTHYSPEIVEEDSDIIRINTTPAQIQPTLPSTRVSDLGGVYSLEEQPRVDGDSGFDYPFKTQIKAIERDINEDDDLDFDVGEPRILGYTAPVGLEGSLSEVENYDGGRLNLSEIKLGYELPLDPRFGLVVGEHNLRESLDRYGNARSFSGLQVSGGTVYLLEYRIVPDPNE